MEGETGKSIWMPTKRMAFWAAHHSLLKRHSSQRNPALGKTGPRALPSLMRKTRARAASSCRGGAREPPNPKSDSLSGSFGMALLSSSAPPCHAHTGGGGRRTAAEDGFLLLLQRQFWRLLLLFLLFQSFILLRRRPLKKREKRRRRKRRFWKLCLLLLPTGRT